MPSDFETFLIAMRSSFRRISYATKGEVTPEDLHSDAWLVAIKIEAKRGHAVDFSNPEDQDLLMRDLYWHAVRGRDFTLRHAARIDEVRPDAAPLADVLPGHPDEDPLMQLIRREESAAGDQRLIDSFSQAVAYIRTNENFRNDRPAICRHLAISTWVYDRRVSDASEIYSRQDSLFDRKTRIAKRFKPAPGRQYAPTCALLDVDAMQFTFGF
ncbi:hypothetical protein [Massilia rubra]|uniref:Uncharacterized protein n=1 Tax=Massilia rubra TaxID=2607910 RepID=A0ABX0LPM5_9BURK|nr:hypothetical protein [Massilia rubra]NHZ36563.1 hypothetical protein [Massilia rubra]